MSFLETLSNDNEVETLRKEYPDLTVVEINRRINGFLISFRSGTKLMLALVKGNQIKMAREAGAGIQFA